MNPAILVEITSWLSGLGAGEAMLVTPEWSAPELRGIRVPREVIRTCWQSGLAWLAELQAESGAVRHWRELVHGQRRLKVCAVSQLPLALVGSRPELAWCDLGVPKDVERELRLRLVDPAQLHFVRLHEARVCAGQLAPRAEGPQP